MSKNKAPDFGGVNLDERNATFVKSVHAGLYAAIGLAIVLLFLLAVY